MGDVAAATCDSLPHRNLLLEPLIVFVTATCDGPRSDVGSSLDVAVHQPDRSVGLHPWQHRLACREAGPGIGSGDEEMPNFSEVFGLGIVFIIARHAGPWSDVSSSLDILDGCSRKSITG